MSQTTLAIALTGENLRDREERVTLLDHIRAAGVAARKHELGLALFRSKYSGQTRELKRAFECLCEHHERHIVEQVVGHWLFDACPDCHGRGHPVFEGTPICDDDVVCITCKGNGTMPPPNGWGQWHMVLWNELSEITYAASEAVMAQLREQMEA